MTYSKDTMERWWNKIYEVSTRRCACITIEVCEEEFVSYQFDGIDSVDAFITWMQHITEHHRNRTIDIVLIGSPT
jgi:hypothetical protein